MGVLPVAVGVARLGTEWSTHRAPGRRGSPSTRKRGGEQPQRRSTRGPAFGSSGAPSRPKPEPSRVRAPAFRRTENGPGPSRLLGGACPTTPLDFRAAQCVNLLDRPGAPPSSATLALGARCAGRRRERADRRDREEGRGDRRAPPLPRRVARERGHEQVRGVPLPRGGVRARPEGRTRGPCLLDADLLRPAPARGRGEGAAVRIRVRGIDRHRNGISGAPFWAVLFGDEEGHELFAVVFDEPRSVAVIGVALLGPREA